MDPQNGSVILDNLDLKSVVLEDLRRQFSLVLQEPVLFSGTIAENISYGRPDASWEEILVASRRLPKPIKSISCSCRMNIKHSSASGA